MKSLFHRTRLPCTSPFHHTQRLATSTSQSQISGTAIRIHETGGVDVLRFDTVDYAPSEHDLLIRNEFAGLNFIDTYHRTGLYPFPAYPVTLGVDGCGIIERINPSTADSFGLRVGDRVAYYDLGSYAQYKTLSAAKAIPIRDTVDSKVDSKVAVASIVQGMTAHYLSRSTFEVTPDSSLVVHAGAGGVGQFLIQIAKKVIGAKTIIATASSPEKMQIAKDLGADFVCGYDDLEETVKEATNGAGADVVYDGVGQSTYATSLRVLRKRGLCVFYGNASGPVPAISPLELSKLGSIYMTRCVLAHYTTTREELLGRSADLMRWISEGKIEVKIDREMRLSLEDVVSAHQYIESGKTTGKIEVKIDREMR